MISDKDNARKTLEAGDRHILNTGGDPRKMSLKTRYLLGTLAITSVLGFAAFVRSLSL